MVFTLPMFMVVTGTAAVAANSNSSARTFQIPSSGFGLRIFPECIRKIVEVVAARREVRLNYRKRRHGIFDRSSVSTFQIEEVMTELLPCFDQFQFLGTRLTELDVKLDDRQIYMSNSANWRSPHLDAGGNGHV